MPTIKSNKVDAGHIIRNSAPGKTRNWDSRSMLSKAGKHVSESRIINVSQKRQITLPLKYFHDLGMGDQVECSLEDGAIVIRPISKDSGEFSVEILKDLVAQGLSGDELTEKFAEQIKQVKTAIGQLLKEVDEIANGEIESTSMKDIFGETEDV